MGLLMKTKIQTNRAATGEAKAGPRVGVMVATDKAAAMMAIDGTDRVATNGDVVMETGISGAGATQAINRDAAAEINQIAVIAVTGGRANATAVAEAVAGKTAKTEATDARETTANSIPIATEKRRGKRRFCYTRG